MNIHRWHIQFRTSVLLLFVSIMIQGAVAWAGDSEVIVFCSDRTGSWRIWQIQPDGKSPQALTEGTDGANDVDPMLSPDKKTILFTSTRGGTAGIWKMPYGSGGKNAPTRICDGDQAEWSPDGTKIVFRRSEKIMIRELNTGKETIISPADWPHSSAPSWSPDGKRIAFAARWNAGNGVYLVAAEGGKPEKLYDKEGACEAHWSPDSKRIVYETETHIRTINADGSENRLLTPFGGVQRYGRFSPDGKTVVFCQGASETGPWEIYTIPATGGAPKQLTSDNSDMHPDWR